MATDHAPLQPYLTELDLRMALLPQGSIDYLIQAMPLAQMEGVPEQAYDYDQYLGNVRAAAAGTRGAVTNLCLSRQLFS